MKRSKISLVVITALVLSGCSERRTVKEINVSIPNGESRCVILFELQSRSVGGPMYWAVHMETLFESGVLSYPEPTCNALMVVPLGGEGVVIEGDGSALNLDLSERGGVADCTAVMPLVMTLIVDQIAQAQSGDLGRCAGCSMREGGLSLQ